MAYSVDDTTIKLTRGDSMTLYVTIYDGDTEYTPVSTDTITFAVKRNLLNLAGTEYADTTPLISKTIPYNTMELTLDPSDTENLGFGVYEYDMQIVHEDGTTDTFIPAASFILTKEVH